jgi:hypothetical protein
MHGGTKVYTCRYACDRGLHTPVETGWGKAWLHYNLEVLRCLQHLQQQQQQPPDVSRQGVLLLALKTLAPASLICCLLRTRILISPCICTVGGTQSPKPALDNSTLGTKSWNFLATECTRRAITPPPPPKRKPCSQGLQQPNRRPYCDDIDVQNTSIKCHGTLQTQRHQVI